MGSAGTTPSHWLRQASPPYDAYRYPKTPLIVPFGPRPAPFGIINAMIEAGTLSIRKRPSLARTYRALAISLLGWIAGCAAPEPAQNLIIISMDTVRRDHIPVYGYARNVTPRLAQLAERSVVFDNAITQDTNTVPTHMSIFTGLYPHTHRSQTNGTRLAPGRVTLTSILKESGFRTGAFVGGHPLRAACGLDRGFDVYSDEGIDYKRDGKLSTDLALEWLKGVGAERYFLFVHYYDAHGPYRSKSGYERKFVSKVEGPELRVPEYQQLQHPSGRKATRLGFYVDSYDTMIHYVDDQIARLLEAVQLEKTIVIVTTDHGETLGERHHVLDHGGQVFDEQLRIPLVVHAPGVAPRRVEALVETVDFLPTALELLGIALPEELGVQGQSLTPLLRGRTPQWRKLAFGTARAVSGRHADRGYRLDGRRRIRTARSLRWKLIHYPGIERDYVELYDLQKDPGEMLNVAGSFAQLREVYMHALDGWASDSPAAGPSKDLPTEHIERLRSMGYLDD